MSEYASHADAIKDTVSDVLLAGWREMSPWQAKMIEAMDRASKATYMQRQRENQRRRRELVEYLQTRGTKGASRGQVQRKFRHWSESEVTYTIDTLREQGKIEVCTGSSSRSMYFVSK